MSKTKEIRILKERLKKKSEEIELLKQCLKFSISDLAKQNADQVAPWFCMAFDYSQALIKIFDLIKNHNEYGHTFCDKRLYKIEKIVKEALCINNQEKLQEICAEKLTNYNKLSKKKTKKSTSMKNS